MFKSKNFCHIASNNRNQVKVGVFTYRTTDNLATVSASGYFNERIIDINLHDIIVHEEIDSTDNTKVKYNFLCVTERTLENVGTIVLRSDWQDDIEQAIEDLQTEVANNFVKKSGDTMTGALKNLVYDYHTPDIGTQGKPVMVSKYIESQNLHYKIYEYKYQNTMAFFFTTVGQNYSDDYTLFDAQYNTSGGVYVASQVFRDSSRQKWIYTFLARPRSSGEVCLGLPADKWDYVYAKKINNGGDLVVPAVSGTLATKADVDLAANSGRMITEQGVWYAKMYAATVAPSAENGTNYADFSQVDGQGNPIIVIYERQNGAWVQSETITPPAEYDGYVPITSKIWDITEQAGQQGGRILWNHQSKEFTPYPQIISFEDAALTGTSTAPTPTNSSPNNQIANKEYVDTQVPAFLATKADTDLSNVSAGIDFVVESQLPTAANNYTWYRKYKSGWVEQGGWLDGSTSYKTTEFGIPVQMANDKYTLTFATYNLEGAATVPANGQTTTGFMIYERVWVGSWFEHNFQGWWKVEGMASN